MLETFFRVLEEQRHERFLGLSHQLDNALLDRILVFVQPTLDVIRHLYEQHFLVVFLSRTQRLKHLLSNYNNSSNYWLIPETIFVHYYFK